MVGSQSQEVEVVPGEGFQGLLLLIPPPSQLLILSDTSRGGPWTDGQTAAIGQSNGCTQRGTYIPLMLFLLDFQGRNTCTNEVGWFPCNRVKPYVHVSTYGPDGLRALA